MFLYTIQSHRVESQLSTLLHQLSEVDASPFSQFAASQNEDQESTSRHIPRAVKEEVKNTLQADHLSPSLSFKHLLISPPVAPPHDRLENNEPSHGAPRLKKNLMRYIAFLYLSFHHHPLQNPPLAFFLSASFKSLPRKEFGGHESGNCTMRRKKEGWWFGRYTFSWRRAGSGCTRQPVGLGGC